jgi:rod shape determining protein RodA
VSQSIRYRRASRIDFRNFDNLLNFAVIGLLFIGTLLVYAGTREWFRSYDLDPEYYLKRHTLNILIGSLLAYGTTLIDYRLLRAYTPMIWLVAVIGLVIVLIPGLGSEINGSRAWISLPGGFQFQPTELAKIAIIVGIAMILADRDNAHEDPTDLDVLKALAIAAVPVLLIVAQPDLGTVLIISAAIFAINSLTNSLFFISSGILDGIVPSGRVSSMEDIINIFIVKSIFTKDLK